jgi:site-specific DNA recombinase
MDKTAAIYARVSSEIQKENYSIGTQLEGCHAYAKQHGFTVVQEFIDAHTGTTLDRPEFDRLKQLAGSVDAVIVYVQDRLGRADELDVWNLVHSFQEAGTEVHATDVGFIDGSDFLKALELLIRARSAKEEAQKIGERSQRGKKARAKAGKVVVTTVAKYGYDYDKASGILTINPCEEQVVRWVYEWYVFGDETGKKLGRGAIAHKLTEMRIPTKHDTTGFRKTKRGYGVWGATSVTKILTDETYCGTWHYNRTSKGKKRTTRYLKPREEWIAVQVPAIVSRELWEAAQEQSKSNTKYAKRRETHDYLLRGRFVCSTCGYLMRCRCDSRRHNNAPYYCCRGQTAMYSADGRTPTCQGSFKQAAIDGLVWNAIAKMLKHPDVILEALQRKQVEKEAELKPDREYLDRCKTELAKLNEKWQRWLQLYLDGAYDKQWLDEQRTQIDQDRQAFEAKIVDLERRIAEQDIDEDQPQLVRQFCERARTGIDHFTFEQKRQVIDLLDIHAILHRGQINGDVNMRTRDSLGRFRGNGYSPVGATISLTGYIPTVEIPADFENTQT